MSRSVLRLVVFLATVACLRLNAQIENQNILIEKLDRVHLTLAPNDPSKVAVTLRLADLYADRARQQSLKGDERCTGCPDAQQDRTRALRLYSEVMDRAPSGARSKILVQMGHLQQMNGSTEKAAALYSQIVKEEKDPALLAEANLSLGEIHFRKREFAQAIPRYNRVLKEGQADGRGLAAYRKAWCLFHTGQIDGAIADLENLLKTPELLKRNGAATAQVDTQFHDEVARDLATFLGKAPLSQNRLDNLFTLSPVASRTAIVQSLAFEFERLGKCDDALKVWDFIAPHLSQPEDRVAAGLSMAQLQLDRQSTTATAAAAETQALKTFSAALQTWRDIGFQDTPAQQELRSRARRFVIGWNQLQKKAPSTELLAAYEEYLAMFPQDSEVQIYAAQTARSQKNWAVAWTHYTTARESLSGNASAEQKSTNETRLESILLTQIELAEEAQDAELTQKAYDFYIAHSPKKSKVFEVRYQKARALYDRADYPTAMEQLHGLALDAAGTPLLRKQAADLSLDAAVLLKDDSKILSYTSEYETTIPQHKAEFAQIRQKAILTQSAALAERDPAAALASLQKFSPAQATEADRIKYFKNKLILAEKVGNIPEAVSAADSLLATAQLSAEDRELAWSRKAYFAELRLDFSTAFSATEKLERSLKPDEKNFKLAVFAELSGKPSSPFYSQYLKQSQDAEKKRLVAAELVRKSPTPAKDLEAVKGVLRTDPELLGQIYAEVYAKTGQEGLAKVATTDSALKSTAGAKLLQRQMFLKEFAVVKKQMGQDQLNGEGNKLAGSIKRRGGLLQKAEAFTQKAIVSGDWTAQLVSLDLLAKESARFYQELLSAPMPAGLSPEDEQEYLNILSAQAAPYQTKANEAKAKVDQFWQGSDWAAPLKTSWQQKSIRKLIQLEIATLQEIAPVDQLARLQEVQTEIAAAARPALAEVQQARQKVYENPNDKAALEALLTLERRADNTAMSDYLATRLDRLNSAGTL